MRRSAASVDYNPFQLFQRLVLTRSRDVYYIGGSDVLPAPLDPKREAYVISKLETDQHQEARSLLIEHNLRLVVYIAKKFAKHRSLCGGSDLYWDYRTDQGNQYLQSGQEYQACDLRIQMY